MNKEDVYKYYNWNPSDGDYNVPEYEKKDKHNMFSICALSFYHKIIKIIMIKFFL